MINYAKDDLTIVYIQTGWSDNPWVRLGTSFPFFVEEISTNATFNAHGASNKFNHSLVDQLLNQQIQPNNEIISSNDKRK